MFNDGHLTCFIPSYYKYINITKVILILYNKNMLHICASKQSLKIFLFIKNHFKMNLIAIVIPKTI